MPLTMGELERVIMCGLGGTDAAGSDRSPAHKRRVRGTSRAGTNPSRVMRRCPPAPDTARRDPLVDVTALLAGRHSCPCGSHMSGDCRSAVILNTMIEAEFPSRGGLTNRGLRRTDNGHQASYPPRCGRRGNPFLAVAGPGPHSHHRLGACQSRHTRRVADGFGAPRHYRLRVEPGALRRHRLPMVHRGRARPDRAAGGPVLRVSPSPSSCLSAWA
jgi:hypothetical protein